MHELTRPGPGARPHAFSDPDGLLSSAFITNGPVYARLNYYPPSVPPAAPIPRFLSIPPSSRAGC